MVGGQALTAIGKDFNKIFVVGCVDDRRYSKPEFYNLYTEIKRYPAIIDKKCRPPIPFYSPLKKMFLK